MTYGHTYRTDARDILVRVMQLSDAEAAHVQSCAMPDYGMALYIDAQGVEWIMRADANDIKWENEA